MPDLIQIFLNGSLWLSLIAAIIVFIIVMALVRLLAWWRNRRVGLSEIAIQLPGIEAKFAPQPEPPTNLPTPTIGVTTNGGDTQINTGEGARQIHTGGAPYIENYNPSPPELAPTGSAAPPARTRNF